MKVLVTLAFFLAMLFQGFCNTTDSLLVVLAGADKEEKLVIYKELCSSFFSINLDSAELFAREELLLAKELSNYEYIALGYKSLGTVHNYKGNFKPAKLYYDTALNIAHEHNLLNYIGTIKSNIGTIYEATGEFDKALECYSQAYKLDSTNSNFEGMNNSAPNIGNIHLKKGEYPEAIFYFKEGLILASELNDDIGVLGALNNLGLAYYRISDYKQASAFYIQALELTEEIKSVYYSTFMLNNLGTLHNDWGNLTKALDYFQKSKKLSKVSENIQNYVYASQNIGLIYNNLNKIDSALFYLNDALKSALEINDTYIQASIYSNMGNSYQARNNFKKANEYFIKSLSIRKEQSLVDDIAISHYQLARNAFLQDKLSEALNYSLECNKIVIDKRTAIDNYKLLADINESMNKPISALEYYKLHTQLKDSVFTSDKHIHIQNLQTQYETEKRESQIQSLKTTTKSQKVLQKKTILISSLAIAILLLLLLIGVFVFQQRRLRTEKTIAVTEQKLLRSQMNPHFIFNALSAIQNFIMSNDALTASSYLSRFAKLMRSILTSSRNEFISLSSEIEMLTTYLDLQKLRLGNKLTYHITVPDSVEVDELKVPPMIAQPFVENAVEHGILKKDSKQGEIRIAYIQNESNLLIKIEDNGIGREEAKKTKNNEHKSYATKITNERLKIHGADFKNASIEITDLYDNSNPTGTNIVIKLPLIFS